MGKKQFTFNDIELNIDEATDRYVETRKEYLAWSKEARKLAEEQFLESFKTYTDFVARGSALYDGLFRDYLQKTVWKLISTGIFDVDEEEILAMIGKDNLKYVKVLRDWIGSIQMIDCIREAKKEEDNEAAKEMGKDAGSGALDLFSGDVSGLFSLSLNALGALGTKGISSVSNYVGKKFDEKEKAELFESEFSRNNLYSAMEDDIYSLNIIYASIVNDYQDEDMVYYYFPTDGVISKNKPMLRNLMAGNYLHDPSQPALEKTIIEKILVNNPYESNVYSYLIIKNEGIAPGLKDLLDYLGMSTDSLANTFLENKYGKISLSVYEEAVEFEKTIIEELSHFGAGSCDYLRQVQTRKQELYVIRRTFKGHVYDTIEMRDEAERQYNDYMSVLDPATMTLDEMTAVYYDTFSLEAYDPIKETIRSDMLFFIELKYDEMKTLDQIMPYYEDAQAKCGELGVETTSLNDLTVQVYKKLNMKAKFTSAAGAAKEKGKALMSKFSFGKGKAQNNEASDPAGPETAAADGNPAAPGAEMPGNAQAGAEPEAAKATDKMLGFAAKGLGSAKGLFKKNKDSEVSQDNAVVNEPAPMQSQPSPVQPQYQPEPAPMQAQPQYQPEPAPVQAQPQYQPEPAPVQAQPQYQPEPAPVQAQPVTENPSAQAQVKYCPQCGKEVQIDKRFCGKCGYRF